MEEIGIAADETYELHELLTRPPPARPRARPHRRRSIPRTAPAHIYRVGRWRRREQDFQYFY